MKSPRRKLRVGNRNYVLILNICTTRRHDNFERPGISLARGFVSLICPFSSPVSDLFAPRPIRTKQIITLDKNASCVVSSSSCGSDNTGTGGRFARRGREALLVQHPKSLVSRSVSPSTSWVDDGGRNNRSLFSNSHPPVRFFDGERTNQRTGGRREIGRPAADP